MSDPVLPGGAPSGTTTPPLKRKLFWVGLLYFAEGFPFGIVYDLLPVYFRSFGVSLKDIGLLSLIGLPWSLKILWSPLVDRFGQRKHWTTAALLGMGLLLALVPLFPTGTPSKLLWSVLLGFTLLSATQDVAIDAYTIGLMEKGEEGAANSLRISTYRAALIVGGGGLVALADMLPWSLMLWTASAIFFALAVLAWRSPRIPVEGRPWREFPRASAGWLTQSWVPRVAVLSAALILLTGRASDGFARWLGSPSAIPVGSFILIVLLVIFYPALKMWRTRWSALAVFAFVLLYKLGDSSMGPMVKPFWKDRGLSNSEIGLISTTIGIAMTVLGSIAGGIFSARYGIFRGLWLLGITQALSNLGYAAVAHWDLPRGFIYGASVFESFTAGLGTSAFLSFLMNLCDRESAAVQYALLSALFGFTRSVAGAASGWATEKLGYASYFTLTFFLAFPAYLLLPWVRSWIRERRASSEAPGGVN